MRTNPKTKNLLSKSLFFMLLVIVVLISGCSNSNNSNSTARANNTANNEAAQGSEAQDKTVTVAISSDAGIDRLDAGAYDGSMNVHAMIYEGLVEYGEKGEILPSLAESWDISEDGKVYTFHLRHDVKFSDGTEFNADAVKFSFERWIKDPANSLNVATAMQSLVVVDEHTITMTFNKAYYPFLTELSFARPVRIISPSAVEPAGDITGKFIKAIGTGAWMAESYKTDQEAILVRNPNYWGEMPKLSKIILKVIPDPQSRVLALQAGDIDIAGGQMGKIPVESVPVIEADSSLTLQKAQGTNSHFMIFNYKTPALQDLNVRKAINLAINKKSIVEDLMDGIGSEAQGLFPLTVPYVTESNNTWYGFNPLEAKQLLAAAGYTDSDGDGIVQKDGAQLELNFVLQQAEYPEWKSISELVQSELKEIGIRVNLQVLEPNAYYDALWTSKAYDLIMYRTYDDAYNPHAFLLSLFHKTADASAVVWSDPGLESLIDTAVGTTDIQERQTAYDSIFSKLYQEAMFAAIYFPDDILAVNNRVTGFKPGYSTFMPVFWNLLDIGEK
ncbi:nickel ABC transporter substrate-binding protein [Paenibacillus odorifer]|uniref:nickel ABC transporter substrate-binding protein n=2 Tax=Paenibacillus TaxID=44249 RepID=UPI00096E3300|nr:MULTISPECIES: nickel ABC transporter substrate-binding protein [Paenibacillus]MDH6430615.1 peptide/nickel transport system substrate-binding protein [Paenibacillus sp. PastH-4]MDH6443638.1 peptide/nickel transport system substrate-binding protein [Paenibacillus sp. PastF-4]MDH6527547.1 peptide/nickel transport system substrate-binding protein [Paenibacillus sp. PastH-3]OMD62219.1 nickel ABC transporter substrate-binding protein [Paenibacillus odorifer]